MFMLLEPPPRSALTGVAQRGPVATRDRASACSSPIQHFVRCGL